MLREDLETWMRSVERVVVCLSGGVDSSVLAAAAAAVHGEGALAVTGVSHSLPERDKAQATALCAELGLTHHLVQTEELSRPDYASNPVNRCFFCKSELFERVRGALPEAERADACLVEGTHSDDLKGHRPGARAATEAGVRSPFVELGWGKDEVRQAAREFGLPESIAERPSSPCLASRVPYGTPVTATRLGAIEQAERVVRSLGYERVRVRHHGDIARIELPKERLAAFVSLHAAAVAERLKPLGFVYCTVDVLGLRSGSLLEATAEGAPAASASSQADGPELRLDLDRAARTGQPEVIFAEHKTAAQVVEAVERLLAVGRPVLVTRMTAEQREAVAEAVAHLPEAAVHIDPLARTARVDALRPEHRLPTLAGELLVVCAGTSDLPAAREALASATFFGAQPKLIADVGVAGIDRLLAVQPALQAADVLIVVAGMEGALPSVVAGMVSAPVFAVPTSVGYGTALGGITPLLAMMTSCAPGVGVVNIDNGFGAAACAARVLRSR